MNLAERIKEYRRLTGCTQVELAAKIGISQPSLVGYETGENKPKTVNAIKLASLLGTTVEELMKEE